MFIYYYIRYNTSKWPTLRDEHWVQWIGYKMNICIYIYMEKREHERTLKRKTGRVFIKDHVWQIYDFLTFVSFFSLIFSSLLIPGINLSKRNSYDVRNIMLLCAGIYRWIVYFSFWLWNKHVHWTINFSSVAQEHSYIQTYIIAVSIVSHMHSRCTTWSSPIDLIWRFVHGNYQNWLQYIFYVQIYRCFDR